VYPELEASDLQVGISEIIGRQCFAHGSVRLTQC
jgi:hypothetical protein